HRRDAEEILSAAEDPAHASLAELLDRVVPEHRPAGDLHAEADLRARRAAALRLGRVALVLLLHPAEGLVGLVDAVLLDDPLGPDLVGDPLSARALALHLDVRDAGG